MNKNRIIFTLLTRTRIPPHRRNSRIRTGLLTAFVKPCMEIGKKELIEYLLQFLHYLQITTNP